MNIQELNLCKFKVKNLRSKCMRLGLHCCSKRSEQLPSWISNCLADSWCSSRHELVHRLWNADCRSDSWLWGDHHLRCIHWAPSLRYYSKSRHISRSTLHCGSLRQRPKSVCNYVRIGAATTLHITPLSSVSICTILTLSFVSTNNYGI